jgi:DNA-binding protein HU-beta
VNFSSGGEDVNKGELIEALESRLGGKKAAANAVESLLDVIIREVARGRKVGITGFGTFERAARAARTGRNPRTGASVKIKKTAVPKFKAGTKFRTVVADPKLLPKTAAAGARAAAGTGTSLAKAAVKKAAPAKPGAKKAAPAKKTTVKKTVVKKAAATLASARKSTPTKATVKKAASTLASARKAAPAKSAAKKTTAKKATSRAAKKA